MRLSGHAFLKVLSVFQPCAGREIPAKPRLTNGIINFTGTLHYDTQTSFNMLKINYTIVVYRKTPKDNILSLETKQIRKKSEHTFISA